MTVDEFIQPENPKPQVSDRIRKLAEKAQKGKIGDDIAMAGVPFEKDVWNKAIDEFTDALYATADVAEAVEKAIAYIKDTDWYKNLAAEDKKAAEDKFRNEHIDADILNEPIEIVAKNALADAVAVEKFGKDAVQQMIDSLPKSDPGRDILERMLNNIDQAKLEENRKSILNGDTRISKEGQAMAAIDLALAGLS